MKENVELFFADKRVTAPEPGLLAVFPDAAFASVPKKVLASLLEKVLKSSFPVLLLVAEVFLVDVVLVGNVVVFQLSAEIKHFFFFTDDVAHAVRKLDLVFCAELVATVPFSAFAANSLHTYQESLVEHHIGWIV